MSGDFLDHSSSIRSGEELDLARLGPYLREHFPDVAGPLAVKQFPSGHSNLTYSIALGEKQMVLRRPPFGSKVRSAHDMGREFHVLSKLHGHFPAPQPLLHCTDDSILGAPFYVMERVRGVVLRRNLPEGFQLSPEKARGLSAAFIDNLAALHRLDYKAIGLGDLGKPDGYLQRQVKGWIERYYGSKTHELPEVARLADWLNANMPQQSGATLIHNDYKYDNVVLDETEITHIHAVLDWEMCTVGDPLTDIGTALAYWVNADDPPYLKMVRWGPTHVPGSLTRRELAERYAQKTGRDLSQIVFYYVFALFKVAVIIQQIYYRYFHGLTKDQRFASLGEVTKMLLGVAVKAIEGAQL
ncbi:MAG TPA: phosphotransferase family protein [Candidatus Limnocylindrales bacterium]|jgi:aminoglycoside phosphotransferase (APT) family kinase protein|nr:phosphotransferase family protein [Candidatus Limnocylindrales bacterium]